MTVIATTWFGRVQGCQKDGVLLFAEVPYAAPPVTERGFHVPAAHKGWTDERDAHKFGPAALAGAMCRTIRHLCSAAER